MSKHNRERRSFREAAKLNATLPGGRPTNVYEQTRLLKHGRKKLAGKGWTK